MIRSFKNTDTEKAWHREHVRSLGPELQRAAQKKLRLLNAASELNSLRVPPGNRLEKLVGDRAGQLLHPHQRPVPDLLRLDRHRPD